MQAGVRFQDLVATLQPHGMDAVHGLCNTVGEHKRLSGVVGVGWMVLLVMWLAVACCPVALQLSRRKSAQPGQQFSRR